MVRRFPFRFQELSVTRTPAPPIALGPLIAIGAVAGLAVLLALGGPGCKDPSSTEGVRKVCEARKTWKHAVRRDCTNCLAKASVEKCNAKCTDRDYSGKCAAEHTAMRKEPTCEGVNLCVHKCGDQDCDCV